MWIPCPAVKLTHIPNICIYSPFFFRGSRWPSRCNGYGMALNIRGSNLGGAKRPVFLIRQGRPWGPHSFLYDGYSFCFLEKKKSGRTVLLEHPHHLAPGLGIIWATLLLPICSCLTCYEQNFTSFWLYKTEFFRNCSLITFIILLFYFYLMTATEPAVETFCLRV